MKKEIKLLFGVLFFILLFDSLIEAKNILSNTFQNRKPLDIKSYSKADIKIKTQTTEYRKNRNKGDEDSENDENSNEKNTFEGMISNLKESVVMIDISSDMQFFEEKSTNSKATGFIVNKELGLIATNKHVTRISPTTHRINFLNGAVEKGNVVYYDFYHDFGFIQLEKAKDKHKYLNSELILCV